MERAGRHPAAGNAPEDAWADAPALRDAAEILARSDADQAEADQTRTRYAAEGMPTLEPDARIAPLLGPGERVVAVRHSAQLDRRLPEPGPEGPAGLGGDLYVTSRRLVLVGRVTLSFDLAEIEDAVISGERLLLVVRGGRGFSLDVAGPRLLRVKIAAARASAGG